MSEIRCPKCGMEQEVNHDDGYGYDEGETFEQDCVECGYEIHFTTHISFDYNVYCSDQHELYQPLDNKPDFYMCENCDYYAIIKEK